MNLRSFGKILVIVIAISGIALGASSVSFAAKKLSNKKLVGKIATFSELIRLLDLNQDLADPFDGDPDHEPIYIDVAKGCYCSCRLPAWSCTRTECEMQDKECAADVEQMLQLQKEEK